MQRKKVLQRAFAASLTAAMCITSLPSAGLEAVWAKGVAAEREDASIVYFVDCGDYVVGTVNDGEQLGTHNSVTDQAYGEDEVTGYKWGIVDGEELVGNGSRKNGTAPSGMGVFTANTWAYEQNTANTDYEKTSSNRYTKNFWEKGIDERFLQYKFQLEDGKYEVYVCCSDPWGCSKTR